MVINGQPSVVNRFNMIRFEHPEFFWAFAALPLLIAFFLVVKMYRKKAIVKLGEEHLLTQLMPDFSNKKINVKFIIWMLALVFLIIAAVNPQGGFKKQQAKTESVDVFIALDISKSMLAQDVSPNRMERSKRFVSDLIGELRGNRIGSIIFAGDADIQMPLTDDYAMAQTLAKSTNTKMAIAQGTAIKEAIELTMKSFQKNDDHQKAMIIVTDGEDHEEGVIKKASEALADGIVIYTVGVGTAGGANIPIFMDGVAELKRDIDGNIVTTKLNEEMLRDIAKTGGGNYFNLTNNDDQIIANLKERIDQLDSRHFNQQDFQARESYFQYPLAIALILLIAEFLMSFKNSTWLGNRDIFEV